MREDGKEARRPEMSLVIVGSKECGKTRLIERFTQGSFFGSPYVGTVGVDCNSIVLHVDEHLVRVRLWDTSGQKAFLWSAEKHLREADGVIFVYDVTDANSFAELPWWLTQVERCLKARDLPKILVGTKADLRHRQVVTASQAKEFGIPEGMEHVEVSAKAARNISVVFYMVARRVMQWRRLGCGKKLGQPSPLKQYGEPAINDIAEKAEVDEDESKEYTHLFKILLVGASRVGKTAARYRFCRGHYADEYYPTSGLESSTRTVRINGEMVRLQIMDVGGDPAYEMTRKNYYRGANAFIVVYDVNNGRSFEKADHLVKELDMHGQAEAPKMVLANKCDADSSKWRVDQDEAKSWADGWRLPLVESSARTGQGIDDAVLKLAVALKRQLAPWKRLYNFDQLRK